MTLGESIKKARTKKRMTQAELARALNTTKAAISRYELDQRQPRYELVEEIARILGADPFELFFGVPKEELSARMEKEVDDHWNELEDMFLPDRTKSLVKAFSRLNDEGQTKAIERVEELAEMPKYTLRFEALSPEEKQLAETGQWQKLWELQFGRKNDPQSKKPPQD